MKKKISFALFVAIIGICSAFSGKLVGPYTIIGLGSGYTEAQAASACPGQITECAYLTANPTDQGAWFFINN